MVVVSSIEWLLALLRVCIFVCNGRRRTREAIVTYEYVHVTGDSRTRREEEEGEEEKEEEKTSTIATVLFVDCHRMPFSGHCWLTKKRSLYIRSCHK